MSDLEILFFFNSYNQESLNSRFIISSILAQKADDHRILFREINVTKEHAMCKMYDVKGVPTTIILKNNSIVKKILGELDEKEIASIIKK